jgi:acetylornithine deacetylase/succinyl-diaminopimelate desuccinylase-like protein
MHAFPPQLSRFLRACRYGFAAILSLAATAYGIADPAAAADLAAARASITAGDAKRHVDALADDTFEGREAGSRGGRAAGAYIVEELARLGLEPAGDDVAGPDGVRQRSFFQPFSPAPSPPTAQPAPQAASKPPGGVMRNILALLPGQDPAVSGELVVASAHYDHVGYGNATNSFGPIGLIHNGADDNASGVAGLIEVAEACVRLPSRPRRTILFAFWDGEEKGLLGSSHFIRERPANRWPRAHGTVVVARRSASSVEE